MNISNQTLDVRVFNDIYKLVKLSSSLSQQDNSHLFDLFKRLLDLIYEASRKENPNEFVSFEDKIVTIYSKYFISDHSRKDVPSIFNFSKI